MSHYLLLAVLVSTVGCGGSYINNSRRTLYVATESLIAVDETLAPKYEEAANRALRIAENEEEYNRRMSEWDGAVSAARAARVSLLAAERALDEYEDNGDRIGWYGALACALLDLKTLGEVADAVSVRLPTIFTNTLAAVTALANGKMCNEER